MLVISTDCTCWLYITHSSVPYTDTTYSGHVWIIVVSHNTHFVFDEKALVYSKKQIHHSTKPKRAQPKLSFILLMMNHTMWVVNFQNKKFGKIYIVHRVYFLYTKIFTKWKFQLMTSSQSNKIYIGKWFLYLNSWHSCDRGGVPYTPFIQYNRIWQVFMKLYYFRRHQWCLFKSQLRQFLKYLSFRLVVGTWS